jgi:lipase
MSYQNFDVEVPGGTLRVGRWGSGPVVVYGLHGLTANHRAFAGLAAVLGPQYTLVAPDLRGRGASAPVAGPFGLAAHADDAVAVLDHLGADRAVFAGHALGGYAAVAAAAKYPDRVERLVLADGGIPFSPRLAPGTPVEDVVRASIGPMLDRLDMTFPSAAAYLDLWRGNPAVGPYWNGVAEEAYRYDLAGQPPALRAATKKDAVVADCVTQIEGSDAAAEALTVPVTLLWAERGMADQSPGLYTRHLLDGWRSRLPFLRTVPAAGENHLMLLMGDSGARRIAAAVHGG